MTQRTDLQLRRNPRNYDICNTNEWHKPGSTHGKWRAYSFRFCWSIASFPFLSPLGLSFLFHFNLSHNSKKKNKKKKRQGRNCSYVMHSRVRTHTHKTEWHALHTMLLLSPNLASSHIASKATNSYTKRRNPVTRRQQVPSWIQLCTLPTTTPNHLAPDLLNKSAHWSGSHSSALNIGAKSAYLNPGG